MNNRCPIPAAVLFSVSLETENKEISGSPGF
jgi:hypothetical protein